MFAYANLASANDCIRCPAARGDTERVCGRSAARRTWSQHSYRGRGAGDGIDDGRSALATASGFSDWPVLVEYREGLGRRGPHRAPSGDLPALVSGAGAPSCRGSRIRRTCEARAQAVRRSAGERRPSEGGEGSIPTGAATRRSRFTFAKGASARGTNGHSSLSSHLARRALAAQFRRRANTETARSERWRSGCVVYPAGFAAPRGCPDVTQEGWVRRCSWNPAAGEAMQKGWAAIQDEASQAVAHLVAVEEGNAVLDLCAAPGGKTILLARAAGSQGHVIAADLHAHRVRAMAERFEAAGVRNVEPVTIDGAQPLTFERRFDRILVDAPCSGTGTLARHPEIRWQLRSEDLTDLHARQVRLLSNGLANLAPSGRLIYSTCSLEPEENELVVQEALGGLQGEFRVVTPRSALQRILREDIALESLIDADGFFRTCPSVHGTDGFFAAAIERTAEKI